MEWSFTVTNSHVDWSGKLTPSRVWTMSVFITFKNHHTLLVFKLPNEIWSEGTTLWWICFWVLSPPRRKQSQLSMGGPFGEAACQLKLFAWRRRFWRWAAGFALGIGIHCYSVASIDNANIFPATLLASSFSILSMRTLLMLWLSATPSLRNAPVLSITMWTFLFDISFTTTRNTSP